jgi:uncharacterized protein YabN with tetrapyrrole methylase and pyrophosphatase domain
MRRQSAPVSEAAKPYAAGLPALFEVVRRLRAPDGCPWDREQTHRSLRPYLLEETYELLEAIEAGDDVKLREELGDVLLQVAMHAEIAAQEGRFDIAEVSEAEAAKMVARHPHVFGDREVRDAEDVLRHWERDKLRQAAREGRAESAVDRVPRTLPALAWALGVQKRAARVGFEYAERPRELPEPAGEEELGDLLFALVNFARKRRLNPEEALRAAGRRFVERFKALEELARARGVKLSELDAEALEALWAEAR